MWVDECAATTGQTGSWSEGIAYDPVTQSAELEGEIVFTPKAASAGSYVTLKFTTTLYKMPDDGASGADSSGAEAQGAVRIGPKGGFQVWTGRPRFVAAKDGTRPVPPMWLDVSAVGITPVSGTEYGISFVFDYAGGKYSVSVKDANGRWKSLQSAAGAQSFPIAKRDAYMVKDILFVGETDFKSLEGSYTSGR